MMTSKRASKHTQLGNAFFGLNFLVEVAIDQQFDKQFCFILNPQMSVLKRVNCSFFNQVNISTSWLTREFISYKLIFYH